MKVKDNKGWIAELGHEDYNHLFGGSSWIVNDPNEFAGGPTLLLNLDLSDPRLNEISVNNLDYLPVCSYINCDLWIEPQHFKIYPDLKKVILVKRSDVFTTILDEDIKFPNPLPEKPIKLREMFENEFNVNEENYWDACDTFVGGSSFIRILGIPLWLQNPEEATCLCGLKQKYVCSIGYDYAEPTGILDNQPFFIGEGALYFFLCSECQILSVLSQST